MSKDETVEASDLRDGCGACCAPGVMGQGTDRYLEILPEDVARGFRTKCDLEYTPSYTDSTKVRCFLPVVRAQNDFTQCEHLRGRVLVDASCGCYSQRPKACLMYKRARVRGGARVRGRRIQQVRLSTGRCDTWTLIT